MKLLFEQVPEKAVARPATAEQHARWQVAIRKKTAQGSADAVGDEMRCRAEQVVQSPLPLPGLLDGLLSKFVAEGVPWHALGRPFLQIGMGEPALQQFLDTAALH